MKYNTFSTQINDILKEPMFFGHHVNVSRYDQQKYPIFEKLIEKQLSFFWRPEEIDLSRDRNDFQNFSETEKHIFLSNLQYQTLLDSIQGRSPNVALLPIVSLGELETWIETWAWSETIHSRSYTHIIRSLVTHPDKVFNNILLNEQIIARAENIAHYYDNLISLVSLYQTVGIGEHTINGRQVSVHMHQIKKALYLALHSINALEAIRFYVSFACTFAFAENNKIEGCAKIIQLIARDEQLHCSGTQHMIQIMLSGKDGDGEMSRIAHECAEEAKDIFLEAVQQEKDWAKYLFSKGSLMGLSEEVLNQYIDYLAYTKMPMVGLKYDKNVQQNPLPWIQKYLQSDNVQPAPQEVEITSYLTGQINSDVDQSMFQNMEL